MPETSIVNLGELTKPATVLIERVCDAVGGIAKPWQIKRVARAEAEADVIRAESRLKITDIEERALRRLVIEEGRRQENIEAITMGAVPYLEKHAEPEVIPEDWLVHFFERSRLTSDVDMQLLWSRLLAGEANSSGSFSRRTIDLLATIEKRDAELLAQLYKTVVIFRDYKSEEDVDAGFVEPTCCVFSLVPYRGDVELSFNNLAHLADLGFINFDPINKYGYEHIPRIAEFRRNDETFSIHTKAGQIGLGCAVLTKAGKELYYVSGVRCSDEYLQEALDYWIGAGHSVSCNIVSNQREV
jgi:hypothetical protein